MGQALDSLCYTSQIFIGIFAMAFLLFSVAFLIANAFFNRPVLKKAAHASLAALVFFIALYLAFPYVEGLLYEGRLTYHSCSYVPPEIKPYCGHDYCQSANWAVPSASNCTCIEY